MTPVPGSHRSPRERSFLIVAVACAAFAIVAHASGAVEALLQLCEEPAPAGSRRVLFRSTQPLPEVLATAKVLKAEVCLAGVWRPAKVVQGERVSVVAFVPGDANLSDATLIHLSGSAYADNNQDFQRLERTPAGIAITWVAEPVERKTGLRAFFEQPFYRMPMALSRNRADFAWKIPIDFRDVIGGEASEAATADSLN